MKIQRIPKPEPVVRLAIAVKKSSDAMLTEYLACYAATYGEAITRSEMVEQVMLAHMQGDKAFAAYQRNQQAAPVVPVAPVTPVAPVPQVAANAQQPQDGQLELPSLEVIEIAP